jgi:hypothetical protein
VRAPALLAALLLIAACDSGTQPAAPAPTTTAVPPATTATQPTVTARPPTTTPTAPLQSRVPRAFDTAAAVATVRHLAGRIGPREATSAAYRQAADWVEAQFEAAGYRVRRQAVPVPSGTSWGVPVRAGTTWNLIATRPGFDPTQPHLVVGAHLDTVPQAPGAEDNASGVAVLVEVARSTTEPRLPTAFIAFGAEEPRGTGDERHHYGSRAYVASLAQVQRSAVRGMVSLDRVGVGDAVPICTANAAGRALQRDLRALAVSHRIPSRTCTNRSSDHWSFARNGLTAVRLGSTPYAAYHSPRDVPGVVEADQLARTGRLVSGWLSPH